jgi:sugar phosphate permease
MAFTGSAPEWMALQFVNGVAQATGWSGLVKIMTNWFQREKRGVVMAWWSSNYVMGAFYATTFATFAATGPPAESFGWRAGLVLPALLLLAGTALFVALVRDEPIEDPRYRPIPHVKAKGLPWAEVAADPAVLTLASAYFFVKLTRYSFLFWLPLYMVQRLGYSAGEAGYSSSLYELAGFAGVLLAGYASDRLFGSRRFPVASLMMVGLAAACLMHPALAAAGRWGNLIGIALIGMMTFGPDTLIGGAAVQDAAKPGRTATAAGFVNGVGSTGQLLSPFLVAEISSRYGWDVLFQAFVALALIGAALLALRWNQPVLTYQEVGVA